MVANSGPCRTMKLSGTCSRKDKGNPVENTRKDIGLTFNVMNPHTFLATEEPTRKSKKTSQRDFRLRLESNIFMQGLNQVYVLLRWFKQWT